METNKLTSISIVKIKELRDKNIIPSSVSVCGNMDYAIKLFKDGNIALYKLATNVPNQKWQYINIIFRKEQF